MGKIIRLLIASAVVTVLWACELERSNNGDLDGFWHLTAVDTLATNVHTDMSQERVYWSFQMRLAKLQHSGSVLARFNHDNGYLAFTSFYWNRGVGGDQPVSEEELGQLAQFGVTQQQERFKVLQLNANEMVLQSEKLKLTFEKW